MTREEFYVKYGDVRVVFSHYYKYTFTYCAELPDGKILTCGCGGDSSEIYRHEVSVGGEESINSLRPFAGSVIENGKEVEGFYDF